MNILATGADGCIEVSGIKISTSKMTVDNERYSIYEDQTNDLVNSITVLKPKQSTRGHTHKHWESYRFDKTGGTLYLNGLGMDITADQKIEIPPNTHHRVINDSNEAISFLCQWFASEVVKNKVSM